MSKKTKDTFNNEEQVDILNRILSQDVKLGTDILKLSREIKCTRLVFNCIDSRNTEVRKLILIVFENEYWNRKIFRDKYKNKMDFVNRFLSQYISPAHAYRQHNMALLELATNSPMGEMKERVFRCLATAHKATGDSAIAKQALKKIREICGDKKPTADVVNCVVAGVYGEEFLPKEKVGPDNTESSDDGTSLQDILDFISDTKSNADLMKLLSSIEQRMEEIKATKAKKSKSRKR